MSLSLVVLQTSLPLVGDIQTWLKQRYEEFEDLKRKEERTPFEERQCTYGWLLWINNSLPKDAPVMKKESRVVVSHMDKGENKVWHGGKKYNIPKDFIGRTIVTYD